jgi:hypothetical protein
MMKSYRSHGGNVFHLVDLPDDPRELLPLLHEDDCFFARTLGPMARSVHIIPNAWPDKTYCGRQGKMITGIGNSPLCRYCAILMLRERQSRQSRATINAMFDALSHPHVDYDNYARGLYQLGAAIDAGEVDEEEPS